MIGTSLVNKLWKVVLYILAGSFCFEKFEKSKSLYRFKPNACSWWNWIIFYDNDSRTSFSYEEMIQLLRLDKADTLNWFNVIYELALTVWASLPVSMAFLRALACCTASSTLAWCMAWRSRLQTQNLVNKTNNTRRNLQNMRSRLWQRH